MMKFLLLILGFTCITHLQGQEQEPPYLYDVVERFFTDYTFDGENEYELRFEKKPKGWFVALVKKQENNKLVGEYLFYDSNTQEYLEVNYKKNTSGQVLSREVEAYTSPYAELMFFHNLYYGYPSWPDDVVLVLETKENKSAQEIYYLARAYDELAIRFLNNVEDKEHSLNLDLSDKKLSEAEYMEYMDLKQKAIDEFEALSMSNPKFKTITGNAKVKYGNEVMSAYIDLAMYANDEKANAILSEQLYDDFILDYAKNLLNSVPFGGILVTGGDNDTYPLLYVQAFYEYRKDVQVINKSLLNKYRYITYLSEIKSIGQAMSFTLTHAQLQTGEREVFIIDASKDKYRVGDVLQFVTNNKSQKYFGRFLYYYIPSNQLMFTNEEEVFNFKVPGNYWSKSDLLILDLMNQSFKHDLPLYFMSYATDLEMLGTQRYCEKSGYVYEWSLDSNHTGEFNEVQTLSLLTEKYAWSAEVAVSDPYILNQQLNTFYEFENQLLDEGKRSQALEVYQLRQKSLPQSEDLKSTFTLLDIQQAYRLNDYLMGDKLWNDHFIAIQNATYSVLDLNDKVEIMSFLYQIADDYGREVLLQKAQIELNTLK